VTFGNLFLSAGAIWIVLGLVWLLPKKIRLMKRVGWLSNQEIIQLAKNGDIEAQKLRKLGHIYLGIGLAVLVPLQLLASLTKA